MGKSAAGKVLDASQRWVEHSKKLRQTIKDFSARVHSLLRRVVDEVDALLYVAFEARFARLEEFLLALADVSKGVDGFLSTRGLSVVDISICTK